MTVAAGALEQGVGAVFGAIAEFLDRCGLAAVAGAVRAQRSEARAVSEEEFARALRGLADCTALALAGFDVGAGAGAVLGGRAQDAAIGQLVDSLMRKLMATRHPVSDAKLSSTLDAIVSSSAFAGLSLGPELDKQLAACTGDLGVSDADVDRFWQQIQHETIGTAVDGARALAGESNSPQAARTVTDAAPTAAEPQAAWTDAAGAARPEPGGAEAVPKPSAPAEAFTAPVEPPPASAHYVARGPRGAAAIEEAPEPEEEDEYHDDDDPGYRIREIYEAELLAELSHKSTLTGAAAAAGGGSAPSAGGEAAAGEAQAPGPSPPGAPASSAGAAPATEWEAAAAPQPQADPEPLQRPREEAVAARDPKTLRYAASGDPFYPVELEGVVYDSFALRVVFQRDKTGFEESKEFPVQMNSVVAARYQILEYLGSAAFSMAVQALDLENNRMVCMKVIKNDKDYLDQSLDEIKLLKYINVNGDVDDQCVLRLYDYFYHKEHLIIVTELLRDNLYEFSKFNRECGDDPYFTLGRLQKISKQVLTALEYVHSLRLIHCDLKPENILIKSYSRCEVKVIDFGSSCFVDDHMSAYVQSRSYRAPEVMLGLGYDQKIDIWSLGCIIAELWTGYVLFQNESVQSLLARILGIIGDFPYHLMTRGRYVPQYFTQDGQLYQEIEGAPCAERGRRLHLLVPKRTSLRQRMRTDCAEFLDFLEQLLQLDPAKRPTASEAMAHPFLTARRFPDGL